MLGENFRWVLRFACVMCQKPPLYSFPQLSPPQNHSDGGKLIQNYRNCYCDHGPFPALRFISSLFLLLFLFSFNVVMYKRHDICIITALILDFGLDTTQALISPTKRVVSLAALILTALTTHVAMCGAPKRMNCMIECLNYISKIPCQPNKEEWQRQEKQRTILTIYLMVTAFISAPQFLRLAITHAFEKDFNDEYGTVLMIYCSYDLMVLFTLLFEVQFICIAMLITSALKTINDNLRELLERFNFHHLQTTRNVQIQVKSLSQSYCTICKVIHMLDDTNGLALYLFLGSLISHFVTLPYHFVDMAAAKVYSFNAYILIAYLLLYAVNLIKFVEPGYRTQQEIKHTRKLVGQLLRRTLSPCELLDEELKCFVKLIQLNQVSYSPLGLCTLNRPLIATIVSIVTTYLVILLQYQVLEKQDT